MKTVRMKINDFEFSARADATILEASRESYGAKQWDIKVPTLHYLKDVQDVDNSGVCVVAVKGLEGLVNASTTKVSEGMEVYTKTPEVLAAQKAVVDKIMEAHDQDCKNCFRTGSCELQQLLARVHYKADPATAVKKQIPLDTSCVIVRDENKCIRCGRCVAVCEKVQGIGAVKLEKWPRSSCRRDGTGQHQVRQLRPVRGGLPRGRAA